MVILKKTSQFLRESTTHHSSQPDERNLITSAKFTPVKSKKGNQHTSLIEMNRHHRVFPSLAVSKSEEEISAYTLRPPPFSKYESGGYKCENQTRCHPRSYNTHAEQYNISRRINPPSCNFHNESRAQINDHNNGRAPLQQYLVDEQHHYEKYLIMNEKFSTSSDLEPEPFQDIHNLEVNAPISDSWQEKRYASSHNEVCEGQEIVLTQNQQNTIESSGQIYMKQSIPTQHLTESIGEDRIKAQELIHKDSLNSAKNIAPQTFDSSNIEQHHSFSSPSRLEDNYKIDSTLTKSLMHSSDRYIAKGPGNMNWCPYQQSSQITSQDYNYPPDSILLSSSSAQSHCHSPKLQANHFHFYPQFIRENSPIHHSHPHHYCSPYTTEKHNGNNFFGSSWSRDQCFRHQFPLDSSYIIDANSNDVLCGRGGATNSHLGNKAFRLLVKQYQEKYLKAKKKEKPNVASHIVETIRKLRPPGRFLKKDKITGYWLDIGDTRAKEKTSQALREGAPLIRKNQSQKDNKDNEAGDKNIFFSPEKETSSNNVNDIPIPSIYQKSEEYHPIKLGKRNLVDKNTPSRGNDISLETRRETAKRIKIEKETNNRNVQEEIIKSTTKAETENKLDAEEIE